MPALNVHIKHAGKVYDIPLNTDLPPTEFKNAIYQSTGVPTDRMKVMIKGGILKDDSDWKKVAPKEGQTFMVIGAAGELPKPPEKKMVFLEDMDESELAQALSLPVGLKNLGNTCYMNATLQTMRAIPELHTALSSFRSGSSNTNRDGPQGSSVLTTSLRDLYASMKTTTDAYTPFAFLAALRQVVPQFAEQTSVGKGLAAYAQQDAEEAWVQITNALNALPGESAAQAEARARKTFVEQYMMAEMTRTLKCDEAPDEEPSISVEKVLKLECNIKITTNFMHSGIMDALDQKIEKNSPTLGRDAVYTQKSRLSRIPMNLAVHMVRFAWKREINKKAKIMRRVQFPLELDILDLCTDELKEKLHPINAKLKELERDRAERRKVRKRTKAAQSSKTPAPISPVMDVEMGDAAAVVPAEPAGPVPSPEKGKTVAGAALEDESVYRSKEKAELEAMIPEEFKADIGCSVTGLYELIGIVTHKGAAADSGHYIGFVKKSAMDAVYRSGGSSSTVTDVVDEDWYKFDDDTVSIFPQDKLTSLEGGGEDAAAYVLLYRSKPLA